MATEALSPPGDGSVLVAAFRVMVGAPDIQDPDSYNLFGSFPFHHILAFLNMFINELQLRWRGLDNSFQFKFLLFLAIAALQMTGIIGGTLTDSSLNNAGPNTSVGL